MLKLWMIAEMKLANWFVMEFNWNPVYGIIPSQVFCELFP